MFSVIIKLTSEYGKSFFIDPVKPEDEPKVKEKYAKEFKVPAENVIIIDHSLLDRGY